MSNIITVIAVQVDAQKAVFLDNTAKRHTVHQTDPALPKLLGQLMPLLIKDKAEADRTGKPQKGVQIDLSTYSMYHEFEEKTGGLVKFFRAAKAKVASFFEVLVPSSDDTTVEEDNMVYKKQQEEAAKLNEQTEVALETVVTEVMIEQSVSVPTPVAPSRPRYDDMKQDLKPMTTDAPLPDDETLVAVINGVVIPGIDSLKPYIAHALKNNSVKAVTAFLERIARVIDTKGHSIPDLMEFIKLGDLPLADDGSIIGYKILNRTLDHGSFTYVDCHSRKVHQRVGTWVRIPEKNVDPDRRRDCSHGLHVARRGYLGSFSGDVCVLIKMAPEDVVAVPQYDSNKVRTCSYFIIGELSKHVYDVLRSGKGMFNDPEAAAMLQKAISGDHISVLEEVWVMGNKGTNLEIRNAVDKDVAKKAIKEDTAKVVETTKAASEIDHTSKAMKADPIDPRALNQKIKEETVKVTTEQSKTKAQLAREAFVAKDYPKVRQIKKAAKVSFERLGFTPAEEKLILTIVPVDEKPKAEPKKKATSIKEEAEARSKKGQPKSNSEKPAPKPVPEAVIKAATAPKTKVGPMSTSEIAQDHYLANRWKELYDFKKSKKKSWDYFGFTSKEIAEIEKNKP